MHARQRIASPVWVALGGAAVGIGLAWVALRFPNLARPPDVSSSFLEKSARNEAGTLHPLLELVKLVAAGLIALVVTTVHKRCRREKPLTRSVEQAMILLGVAGALVMIIIGNSLPRAFGAFGIASIIRFRTPLKDPKDAALVFLLVGLGMACGVGAFAVAALGAGFLSLFLITLDRLAEPKTRAVTVELVGTGPQFPTQHVQSVFARHGIVFEPREVQHGEEEAVVKYQATLDPSTSLEELSAQLLAGGTAGLKSVEWTAKKGG